MLPLVRVLQVSRYLQLLIDCQCYVTREEGLPVGIPITLPSLTKIFLTVKREFTRQVRLCLIVRISTGPKGYPPLVTAVVLVCHFSARFRVTYAALLPLAFAFAVASCSSRRATRSSADARSLDGNTSSIHNACSSVASPAVTAVRRAVRTATNRACISSFSSRISLASFIAAGTFM